MILSAAALVLAGVIAASVPQGQPKRWAFLEGRRAYQAFEAEQGWLMKGVPGFVRGKWTNEGPPMRNRYEEFVYQADFSDLAVLAAREAEAAGGRASASREVRADHRVFLGDNWELRLIKGWYDPVRKARDERFVRVIATSRWAEPHGVGVARWARSKLP